jgi:hypothetical protein
MGWRSQLLWSNLSTLNLEFQPENSKAPSEDPILQSQTTGIPKVVYMYGKRKDRRRQIVKN